MLEEAATAKARLWLSVGQENSWLEGTALLGCFSGRRSSHKSTFLEVTPFYQQRGIKRRQFIGMPWTSVPMTLTRGHSLIALWMPGGECVTRGLSRRTGFHWALCCPWNPPEIVLLPFQEGTKKGRHWLKAKLANGRVKIGTQGQSQDSSTLPCHAICTEPVREGLPHLFPLSSLKVVLFAVGHF